MMNVSETILSCGANSAAAVLHKDTVLTYAELREKVAGLASALLARGDKKGDRIGGLSDTSPFFVKAYLGIIRAGMVAGPFPQDLARVTSSKLRSGAGVIG